MVNVRRALPKNPFDQGLYRKASGSLKTVDNILKDFKTRFVEDYISEITDCRDKICISKTTTTKKKKNIFFSSWKKNA